MKSQAVYQEAVTACQKYVIKNGDEYNGDDEAIMFALKEGQGVSKLINDNKDITYGFSPRKKFGLKIEDACKCPVCFEAFSKKVRVFQCSEGQFTCGKCKP